MKLNFFLSVECLSPINQSHFLFEEQYLLHFMICLKIFSFLPPISSRPWPSRTGVSSNGRICPERFQKEEIGPHPGYSPLNPPAPPASPAVISTNAIPPLTTPRSIGITYPRFRRCGASSEGACADLPHLRLYHCAFPPLPKLFNLSRIVLSILSGAHRGGMM